jgi:SAM-dependent methyltransferase
MADLVARAVRLAAGDRRPVLEVVERGRDHGPAFTSTDYRAVAPSNEPLIDSLPVDSGRVGVVLCPGSIERSPEPTALMAELGRVLCPNGHLVLSTPLVIERRPPLGWGLTAPDIERHLGLNYLLVTTGFELEDLWALAGSSYAVVARKISSRARATTTWGRLRPGPLP